VFLLIATMEGSLTTMPLPRAYTKVFAVPRSIARSLEKMLKSDRRLWNRPALEWNPLDDIRLTSLSLKSDDCLSVAAASNFRSGGYLLILWDIPIPCRTRKVLHPGEYGLLNHDLLLLGVHAALRVLRRDRNRALARRQGGVK
jgi:hypothetical protein